MLLYEGVEICPDFVWSSAGEVNAEEYDAVLPHARGAQETVKLVFTSSNRLLEGLTLELRFSLFETALVRQAVLINRSDKPLKVMKLMSACADLQGSFMVSTFDGRWIREAHIHTVPVTRSRVANGSAGGFSSNRHNPGLSALVGKPLFLCPAFLRRVYQSIAGNQPGRALPGPASRGPD